ncbi:Chromosome segregation in meiosis protein 3 [Cyphellophora attinorum]|uniref:Chromosome segregation in meiosis protein n=1 Tax=Cyphellophora attinorum TaxID=1664694 RepID=A0A0N1H479_9EURO|nr:Chromosome segregation in meiosis protein 3 [Phialophora attinorum]KPI35433.1 Chromosome segregation in meiosis protein 3 [Phialophora attinorum]
MAADPLTAETTADLLQYDLSDDDPFADNPTSRVRDDKATLSPRGTKRKTTDDNDDFLGLNEEVKIAKKRRPVVKLDEDRLLRADGIPKLRTIARSSSVTRKLRMKGKGHEFSDIARLLNFYQLWLDGLFPRAKFADGLQLIEKVGHSKRMQVMRKEWIDEGKPGYIRPGTELVESILRAEDQPSTMRVGENGQPLKAPAAVKDDVPLDDEDMFFPSPSKAAQTAGTGNTEDQDDDELDALLAMQDSAPAITAAPAAAREDDSEGEDDLDALLAEQDSHALLAEQDTRQQAPALVQPPDAQPASSSRPSTRDSSSKKKRTIFDDSDSEGELENDTANDANNTLPPLPRQPREVTPPTSPAQVAATETNNRTPVKQADEAQDLAAADMIFLSSPIRNDEESQNKGLEGGITASQEMLKTYSSSPLPNNPEEDDLDALLEGTDM